MQTNLVVESVAEHELGYVDLDPVLFEILKRPDILHVTCFV